MTGRAVSTAVVSNIRQLPTHSRFLLPSLFSDLQCAANGGPVIIVNASKYSCDALFDRDPMISHPHPVVSYKRGCSRPDVKAPYIDCACKEIGRDKRPRPLLAGTLGPRTLLNPPGGAPPPSSPFCPCTLPVHIGGVNRIYLYTSSYTPTSCQTARFIDPWI